MKITLHFKRHFSGRQNGTEMQIHALVARHSCDDAETESLAQSVIHILQEGAKDNFIRLFLKNDTSRNADCGISKQDAPMMVALKARCNVAEQQARAWKMKYEESQRKLYSRGV